GFAQQLHRLVKIGSQLTHYGQVEHRAVFSQQTAVAVIDQTTGGRNKLGVQAIAFRALGVIIVIKQLEVDHPAQQNHGEEGDKTAGHNQTATEDFYLVLMLVESEFLDHVHPILDTCRLKMQ